MWLHFPNTYTLQNMWKSAPYAGRWLTYSDDTSAYLHVNATNQEQEAMRVEFVPVPPKDFSWGRSHKLGPTGGKNVAL